MSFYKGVKIYFISRKLILKNFEASGDNFYFFTMKNQ